MRLIDADALSKAMYDEAFENDESYNETNPMARWDSGLWIRYKMFEKCLRNASTIEPNLVINPDEIERGDVVEIGENIVVMHHDDYYDMFLKSELYDDIKPCEDAISRENAIKNIECWKDEVESELDEYFNLGLSQAIAEVKRASSVAPSRPKGEWKITNTYKDHNGRVVDRVEHTDCGYIWHREMGEPLHNFCPNCGADMRGEDDE